MTTPNRFQRAILDLIEATEDRLKVGHPFNEPIREHFAHRPEEALRDYCTVGVLLPQRTGRTVMVQFFGERDLLVFTSERERIEHLSMQEQTRSPSVVGIDNLHLVEKKENIKRVVMFDPFWMKQGVDQITFYQKIVQAFRRPLVVVLTDSPFTQ